jgi:hypothetical protein
MKLRFVTNGYSALVQLWMCMYRKLLLSLRLRVRNNELDGSTRFLDLEGKDPSTWSRPVDGPKVVTYVGHPRHPLFIN